MSTNSHQIWPFFIVGPLRTGSSLITRCLDDHPSIICLCESEINRALFRDYFVDLHCRRMVAHGLPLEDAVLLLREKRQESPESLMLWYAEARLRLAGLYAKEPYGSIGDKSPDFYRSPALVEYLLPRFPLIYTVRDPRAILASIEVQTDSDAAEKAERWGFLAENYRAWRPHLDAPNMLVVRYEDLVSHPDATMRRVHDHLGVPHSTRFLEPFARPYPERFLWSTAVDWETGVRKDFDTRRIWAWKETLKKDQLDRIRSDATIVEFMRRFGYED